jgi:hypothetical protein
VLQSLFGDAAAGWHMIIAWWMNMFAAAAWLAYYELAATLFFPLANSPQLCFFLRL